MSKLFLLRHLKSQWNEDNRFAGWVDNPLSEKGRSQVKEISEKIAAEKVDVAYAGSLIRITETILRIFDYIPGRYPLFIHMDGGKMEKWGNFEDIANNDLKVFISEDLNERYYGKIQGLNKDEVKAKYGEELVQKWRRGYFDKPPGGESMKDTYDRAVPFYRKHAEKSLKEGKNVLVVGSHNSLRAVVKYIENISDEDIINFELDFGELKAYEFDGQKFIRL